MQLKTSRPGMIAGTLAGLAAGLLAGAAQAQDDQSASPQTDAPLSRVDTSLLVYQEDGGRVQAIEPSATVTLNGSDNHVLTFGFTADSLTGASPNGAVPSDKTQTFMTPLRLPSTSMTVTTASGGSTVIQVPPTPGQIANANLYGRQYTVAPGQLPVDPGFNDQRYAGSIGWSQPIGRWNNFNIGASYSSEHDYRAITGNLGLTQDLNGHNTTLSAAVNLEFDKSFPYGGTPTPYTPMSAQWKGPGQSRHSEDFVGGLTQIMTRNWIVQLNYSYGLSNGYQNDPYLILSVVDPSSGEPTGYLYENRPRSRTRQSVYLDNKVALGWNIFEVSGRYFWDDWGIKSETVEASDRISLGSVVYVQPHVRWYHQTAASFFNYYLVGGQPLPQYASSDFRLGRFKAWTFGATVGFKVFGSSEFYVRGDYYEQLGDGHPAGAFGQLANQNLFAGVKAKSIMVGYSYGFY